MNKGVDLSKNIGITSYQEIMSICKPLYSLLDITYFNYVKLFSDGSRSVLTDRTDFITQYYASPELYKTKAVLNMENFKNNTVHFSSEFSDQLSYQVARNDFDIANGLTIIQPALDCLELYYFGTKKENYSHSETYRKNIDLFYRFIVYFKEKAGQLIHLADKEKFYLPGVEKNIPPNSLELNIESIRRAFLEATKPNKIITKNINDFSISLTYREAEIIHYLSKLSTAKKVSKHLNISYRTVETHLAVIKEKLGYRKKSDLVAHLKDSLLGDELTHCFIDK